MKAKTILLVVCSGLAFSCSHSSPPPQAGSSPTSKPAAGSTASPISTPVVNTTAAAAGQKMDPCRVLTSDELKSIQGEPLKDAKASERADGGFSVSQCFYTLPTFTKSVSVEITSAGTRDPKEFWKESFHREEGEKEKQKEGKDRKKDEAAPEKVAGIGDEAFWLGSPIGGALYVLKKDVYFRISVGGADDQTTRLNKAKALAKKILPRV